MPKPEPLHEGQFYHIYNRGNNRKTIFRTAQNYRFFLKRYAHYIEPVAKSYAYSLLPNHYHFTVRIQEKTCQGLDPSKAFSNLYNSYAKSFNRLFGRTGSLFEKPFKRKVVDSERYFVTLVVNIHRNAQRHGLVDDFRDWPWSSCDGLLAERTTRLQRVDVLDWFGGRDEFVDTHRFPPDVQLIESLIGED